MGELLGSKSLIPENVTKLLRAPFLTAASIAVAGLEFDIPNLEVPRGFGHLVPLCEDEVIMGVVYDSQCSPLMNGKISGKASGKTTRFTVMLAPPVAWLKATSNRTSFDLDLAVRDKIIDICVETLRKHLGLKLGKPCCAHVGLWSNTIPTYPVGHLDNVQKIRNSIESQLGPRSNHTLQLVGSALDGIGVGDCVRSALKAVEKFS